MRINAHGGTSVAFTTNPEGKLAGNCKYTIPMTLPSYDLAPNVTSYYSSLFSLMMFGFYMSKAKDQLSEEQAKACREGLLEYVNAYEPVMDQLSRQAYDLARKWEDDGVDNMDFIGDGADYATAFFGSAKMVEAFGGLTTNDDSEDWCHINYFLVEPEKIGRVVVANKPTPSYNRILETIHAIELIESPCIILTDADRSEFPETMEVFTVPAPKYFWMAPLTQHIPFDMVAGYIAALKNVPTFRADDERYSSEISMNRLKSGTQIKIY